MKTFDYETAWLELALPAFQKLPESVMVLLVKTQEAAGELSQLPDCSMPWPEDGGKLRNQFEALDSETLSNAALVVNYYGHWRPSANIAGDAITLAPGASWKFSHYCDQVLRARFNIGNHDSKAMVSKQIYEGTIRLCYSSRDMWTWNEVAPATEAGIEAAAKLADQLRRKLAVTSRQTDRDDIAYKFMEELEGTSARPDWNTAHYMVEESELEVRRLQRMPKVDKDELVADVKQSFEKDLLNLTTARDGKLWLIENNIPIGNAIYYSHTGRWSFGWRKPYVGEAREAILKALAKFPFEYDVQ